MEIREGKKRKEHTVAGMTVDKKKRKKAEEEEGGV